MGHLDDQTDIFYEEYMKETNEFKFEQHQQRKRKNSQSVYDKFEKKIYNLVSIDMNKYIYYIFDIVYKIQNKFKQKEMVKSE